MGIAFDGNWASATTGARLHVPVLCTAATEDASSLVFTTSLRRVAARRASSFGRHCPRSTMSEPTSDPPDANMLFSPVRQRDSDRSSDAPAPGDTSWSADDSSPRAARVAPTNVLAHVEVPRLSNSQIAKYKSIADEELHSDEEYPQENVDRVVGDVQDGSNAFLYVRYKDGIIYKVSSMFRRPYLRELHGLRFQLPCVATHGNENAICL